MCRKPESAERLYMEIRLVCGQWRSGTTSTTVQGRPAAECRPNFRAPGRQARARIGVATGAAGFGNGRSKQLDFTTVDTRYTRASTGAALKIPAGTVPKFTAGSKFKAIVDPKAAARKAAKAAAK